MEVATRSVNVTDQAFALLRDAILTGELKANSLHSVTEFANQLKVSRTPIREAVIRLVDAGMVTIERNRGVRICSSNVEDVRWLFELRTLLEVPAAQAAAHLQDPDLIKLLQSHLEAMAIASQKDDNQGMLIHHRAFHETIDSALQNKRMNSIMDSLRNATRARSLSVPRGRSNQNITDEHVPIFQAIESADSVGAAEAMRNHLLISGRLLMHQVAIVTGEEVPSDWEDIFLHRIGVLTEK